MNIRNNKTVDIRSIKRHNKDGTITTITVDWNKLPCSKCERRYHLRRRRKGAARRSLQIYKGRKRHDPYMHSIFVSGD